MKSHTLWTKNFTIITLGTVISAIGGVAMSFALGFVVFDATGSTLLSALFTAVSTLPQIVLPILVSPCLDNFRRRPVIFGLDYLASGEIYIEGNKVKLGSPHRAMKNGISFLTENRREEGLVLKMDIRRNLTFPILDRISVPGAGYVRRKKEMGLVKDAFSRFLIKATGPEQRSGTLSGGNQQKVVLSKWFMTESKVLILDEPTRGVDVGAKAEIYELITEMVSKGLSVIMISCEESEMLGMCHRILVMRDGEIIGEFNREDATQEKLVGLCMGGKTV